MEIRQIMTNLIQQVKKMNVFFFVEFDDIFMILLAFWCSYNNSNIIDNTELCSLLVFV